MYRLILAILLTVATSATAGPLEDGLAAYGRGDYQTAVRFFQQSANAGNAEAQSNLASMYTRGRGVTRDYAEAAKLYRQAAEAGHADAQLNLGSAYAIGRGVPQNFSEAVKWLRMAAEQGNASAQYNLAAMYALGRGVPKDYVQAHKWYSISASRPADPFCCSISSAWDATSRYIALEGVTDTASMMTPAQLREAHELVAAWKPTKRR